MNVVSFKGPECTLSVEAQWEHLLLPPAPQETAKFLQRAMRISPATKADSSAASEHLSKLYLVPDVRVSHFLLQSAHPQDRGLNF